MTREEAIRKEKMRMNRFIECYKNENVETKYSAGHVIKNEDEYIIAYETMGAKETFSIGQPVYDKDGNIMGYMGIGLYRNLNYSAEEAKVRIPVEHWTICLPTKHCAEGKHVYTYWQHLENIKSEDEE